MNAVIFTRTSWNKIIRELARDSSRIILFPAGLNQVQKNLELIARGENRILNNIHRLPENMVCLWSFQESDQSMLPENFFNNRLPETILKDYRGYIAGIGIGSESAIGYMAGYLRCPDGEVKPLSSIYINGPELIEISFRQETPSIIQDSELWSRTIGALGGEDTWSRITRIPFCIVGAGRSGSMMAKSLVKLGVKKLWLTDFDTIEKHNLDSMEMVVKKDLGRKKVDVLKDYLDLLPAHPSINVVPESIMSFKALRAVKESRIITCTVDNDAARIGAVFLSAIYSKIFLDVGTGVFIDNSEQRQMGSSVRLILPGQGCLLCMGGISDMDRAREIILGKGDTREVNRDWRLERSGSVASLNQIGVNLGIRLLEDLAAGRVSSSTFLQVEYNNNGIPSINSRTFDENNSRCPLCRLSGKGDEALGMLQEVLF
ncbi:MAG: ThiF family adenylyltransferase [Candidatus Eremiobacteraeota bacterium]|nr:ThiF family adenylyltransferase [Candidatus Eremiobacteraeota bacterium]